MTVFHYALRVRGFLMLGRAESTGLHPDLFQLVDKKARIFQRKTSSAHPALGLAAADGMADRSPPPAKSVPPEARGAQLEATRLLLARYAPPGVLVDSDLHIVQARGHTGPFLELAPGDASLNLLKMAREGLLFGLRAALNEARRSGTAVRREGMRVRVDGVSLNASLEVLPLGGPTDRHFLVLFEPGLERPDGPARPRKGGARPRRSRADDSRGAQLQQELAARVRRRLARQGPLRLRLVPRGQRPGDEPDRS